LSVNLLISVTANKKEGQQQQAVEGKQLKKRLKMVLLDKIEKVRVKQAKKRDVKSKHYLTKKLNKLSNQEEPTNNDDVPMIPREVLIRLKPFTEASKEYITKDRKKNALLQFRLTVMVPVPESL
jgi:NAD+--asparagine ADP-ribosyltransferase